MSAKMQVMFTTPQVFGLRILILSPVRCKMTKADALKRLNKENNALFGKLIETRKEKLAREKFEKKNESFQKYAKAAVPRKKVQPNTEINHMSNLEDRQVFRVKFKAYSLPYYTKKFLRIISATKSSENIENSQTKSTDQSPTLIPDAVKSQPTPEADTSKRKLHMKFTLPSDVFINRITSFPYVNVHKTVPNYDIESNKPISISPYSDESKLPIPSVTRILNKTMSAQSKLNLEIWKQTKILELGQEGFEKYSQELLLNGKQFHSSIQNHLIQEPFEVPSAVENSWQSVQHVLKEISSTRVIESHVVHSKLLYRGIVDCVGIYRRNLCVIDWKKSDKPKDSIENTFDAPIQVASYIGALNSDNNYKFQVRHGLVVVGYTNGAPATVHELSPTLVNKYWILWLRRLQQYYLDLKSAESDFITIGKKNEQR